MNEITKDKLRANAVRASDLRDVAGAWLVCALVAAIALGLRVNYSDQTVTIE